MLEEKEKSDGGQRICLAVGKIGVDYILVMFSEARLLGLDALQADTNESPPETCVGRASGGAEGGKERCLSRAGQ